MRRTALAISVFLAVLLLALAACGGDLDSDQSAGGDGGNVVVPDADQPGPREEPSGGNADGFVGGVGDVDSGDPQAGLLDRKIIRTATIKMTVENVLTGMQEVEQIAANAGGFVSGSDLAIENPQDDESERRQIATVTIRVPNTAYGTVMNQLRGIAEDVKSETNNTSEVTEEYTDLESRLRTLEATELRYLDLLQEAETIDEILTVQDRLDGVVSQIEQIKGRLNLLDDLTELATITATLELPPVVAVQSSEGKGWAEEAWDTAWATSEDALKVVGTAGIAMGVLAIWLAVPGALGLIGWRLYEQRKAGKGAA